MAVKNDPRNRLRKETLKWISADAARVAREHRVGVHEPRAAADLLAEKIRLERMIHDQEGAPVDLLEQLVENRRRLRESAAAAMEESS